MTEIVVYAASALISFALLGNLLKKLDPNAQNSKQVRAFRSQPQAALLSTKSSAKRKHFVLSLPPQAKAKRKEIAGRLGRPLLECNQYEDVRYCARSEHPKSSKISGAQDPDARLTNACRLSRWTS